jgi:hypothetical protein
VFCNWEPPVSDFTKRKAVPVLAFYDFSVCPGKCLTSLAFRKKKTGPVSGIKREGGNGIKTSSF